MCGGGEGAEEEKKGKEKREQVGKVREEGAEEKQRGREPDSAPRRGRSLEKLCQAGSSAYIMPTSPTPGAGNLCLSLQAQVSWLWKLILAPTQRCGKHQLSRHPAMGTKPQSWPAMHPGEASQKPLGQLQKECSEQAGPNSSALPPAMTCPGLNLLSEFRASDSPLASLHARERLQPSFEESGGTTSESARQLEVMATLRTTSWGTSVSPRCLLGECRSSGVCVDEIREAPSLSLTTALVGL